MLAGCGARIHRDPVSDEFPFLCCLSTNGVVTMAVNSLKVPPEQHAAVSLWWGSKLDRFFLRSSLEYFLRAVRLWSACFVSNVVFVVAARKYFTNIAGRPCLVPFSYERGGDRDGEEAAIRAHRRGRRIQDIPRHAVHGLRLLGAGPGLPRASAKEPQAGAVLLQHLPGGGKWEQ